MTQIFEHIKTRIEDWPVAQQAENRSEFIQRLNTFVLTQILPNHKDGITELINKTIYLEGQRVKLTPWKVDPIDDPVYWKRLATEMTEASTKSNRVELEEQILKRIINRYNEEIVGGFNVRTFKFIRIFLLSFFKRLLHGYFTKGKFRWGNKKQLQDSIVIKGDVEKIRGLFDRGTVVIMPTHYSNLDSIMVGYGIDLNVGLPSFAYGAGLNLYNYELVAYLMNRMGAFRVDRRKKNPIYLECLKSYTSYSVFEGLNCIFFPGGTRSRSGETEAKLKLGMINSLIEAQRMYLESGQSRKIFVVPLNIGYHFVLEANSLVEEHLKLIGNEKYQRARSTGPSMITISRFMKDLYTKDNEVYLSFGDPIDVLGNKIDGEGRSLDKFGHTVDIMDYFSWEGRIGANIQREGVYAKKLGESVVEAFKKFNPVLSSNVITFVAFMMIYHEYQESGLIHLLNQRSRKYVIDLDSFRTKVFECIEIIKDKASAGELVLSNEDWSNSDQIIKDGLTKVGIYHASRVLEVVKDEVIIAKNLRLLYFYHNRLVHYKLEQECGWDPIVI
jgi:glycerol-3-phosphate O-acyltransferase